MSTELQGSYKNGFSGILADETDVGIKLEEDSNPRNQQHWIHWALYQ